MPATVEKLPNEPILIYHYSDTLTKEEVVTALTEAAAICAQTDDAMHLIHNATAHMVGASGIIKMAAQTAGQTPIRLT